MTLLLALLACTDKDGDTDPIDSGDTGLPECGRVRGTQGVMMFSEGDVVHAPTEAPDATTPSHSVAGPLTDGLTWLVSYGGRIEQSLDAGCNWERVGALPATGWWDLVAAGDRVYAFDRGSGDGARSDDAGVSWSPFDSTEAFVGPVTVAPGDPSRLRGLQARGVVTSSDGGDSWQVTGTAPPGIGRDVAVFADDLDTIAAATDTGLYYTRGGGTTWYDVGTTLPRDKTATTTLPYHVAISPDDLEVLYAMSLDDTGLWGVSRTADHGANWDFMITSDGVRLNADSDLWPVPGRTDQVISAYGSSTDSYGIDLLTMTAGEATHTLHVGGGYYNINVVRFEVDRWVAAVDGVVD
jgi:hypothetical protein